MHVELCLRVGLCLIFFQNVFLLYYSLNIFLHTNGTSHYFSPSRKIHSSFSQFLSRVVWYWEIILSQPCQIVLAPSIIFRSSFCDWTLTHKSFIAMLKLFGIIVSSDSSTCQVYLGWPLRVVSGKEHADSSWTIFCISRIHCFNHIQKAN